MVSVVGFKHDGKYNYKHFNVINSIYKTTYMFLYGD